MAALLGAFIRVHEGRADHRNFLLVTEEKPKRTEEQGTETPACI